MKMKLSCLFALVLSTLLTSCSLFSPLPADSNSTYVLNTLPSYIPKREQHASTILVMPPDTQPVYNTTQMAYTIKPYQIAYFGRNQWAETPSQMLLPLIVQSLQNTRYFHAVVTPPYAGRYQYLLTTQILKLQQNYVKFPHVVELVVRAQLTRTATNQVVAIKQFTVSVPIKCRTPYSGVSAANQATAKILADLTNFTLQHS